jgi:ATP-dependent Clp protease ATP-binding subunit ClpX
MPEDLIKFGLIPELIGRVPVVQSLDMLDEAALIRILTEPKNALVKQYQKLFDLDGVQLTFTPDAIELIAKQALERKTGARGLRAIIEKAMMDIMFTIPSDESIGTCTVTKEVIENKEQPLLTYRDVTVNNHSSRRRLIRKHEDSAV